MTFVASDNRRNPGSQFVAVNRLGDGIIGPEIKCPDPIVAVAFGECHERRAPHRTQASDERRAILMQRDGINQHKIESVVAQYRQPFGTVQTLGGSSHDGANREEQNGRADKAADARVKGGGECAIGHQLWVCCRKAACHATHRAHQSAEGHGRARIVQADQWGDKRRAHHQLVAGF